MIVGVGDDGRIVLTPQGGFEPYAMKLWAEKYKAVGQTEATATLMEFKVIANDFGIVLIPVLK